MKEKKENGIIGLDDMFKIQPSEEIYNREDDILPLEGEKKEPDSEEGEGNPGGEPDNVVEDKDKGNKDEEEETNVVPADPVQVDYLSIIRKLEKKGILPDLSDAKFGMEDGTELSLDEIKFDEDTFCTLMGSVIENQKNEILENKIDVASVSDLTKKLIQADKSGANILDILKQYDKVAAPVEKLSTDTKDGQLKIIRHYVGLMGLPKEEADDYYNSIVSKGDDYIEAKAIRYKSELERKMNEIIDQQTKEAAEQRAKDAEAFKQYKKALKESFRQKYQLNDNMVSKAMDYAIKPSKSNPSVTEANERIREMLTNPELAPDLIMFLMNPEEFIKQKSNLRVVDEKRKIFKMISSTNKDRSKAPITDTGDESKGMKFEEIELNENKLY